MTLPDYLTLGLSIVAFVFSIITFVYNTYEQYLKAARLQLVLGSQLRPGFLDGQQKIGFWVPVVLTNQGAVDAVVLRIEGELTQQGGKPVGVEWYTVGDYDGAKDEFIPKGWTDTLIVSSRKATTTWIGLRTTSDVAMPETDTDFTLTLNVYAPVVRRRAAQERLATSWTGTLTLQTDKMAEVTKPAAGAPAFDLRGGQFVHLQASAPRSVTALVPGLKDVTIA
ncbi:MAG TPA: hypothetical protein VFN97_02090 [Actinospica sp.]|nr:hypothetical protein [Actinospica sp.]